MDSPLMVVVVEVGMFVGRGGRDVVGRGMVFAVVRLWVGYVVVARGKDEVKKGGGGGGDVVKEDDDGGGEDGCECRRDDMPPRGSGSGVPSSTVGTVVLPTRSLLPPRC